MSTWGVIGRQKKSEAQAEAARNNGRLGGRPRKDGKPPIGAEFRAAIQRATQLRAQIEEVLVTDSRALTKEERLEFRKFLRMLLKAESRWNLELSQLIQ